MVGHAAPGELGVDHHVAVRQRTGADVAQHDVGVGQRGLLAAPAVAGGARPRPCRARADSQAAGRVHVGHAAAAGADLGDVDGRRADQLAPASHQAAAGGQRGAHLVLGGIVQVPALDQRRLGGGAAHVQGDDVGHAESRGGQVRGQDAGRGTGLQHEDRPPGRMRLRGQAARGLHDEQWGGDAQLVQAPPHRQQVRGHRRAHVGVDRRGRRALVFAPLRQDVARQRHLQMRQLPAQERADLTFVPGIGVGVQQADSDRLHPFPHQLRGDALELVLPHAAQDLAGGGDPLVQLEPKAALDEGRRLGEEQVVELRGAQAAQLQHVAESGGGDQRGARAAAFQHGVGRHRRAMGDHAHGAAVDAGQAQRAPDARESRLLEVRRCGRQLVGPDPAGRIGEHDVGEGPADVGADAHRPLFLTRHDRSDSAMRAACMDSRHELRH